MLEGAHGLLKLALSSGAEEAEVAASRWSSQGFYSELGEPKASTILGITEYALRLVVHGSVGFAYLTSLQKAGEKVESAVKMAKARATGGKWPGFPPPQAVDKVAGITSRELTDLEPETLIEYLDTINAAIEDPRIQSRNTSCAVIFREIGVLNSTGVVVNESRSYFSAAAFCKAVSGADHGIGAEEAWWTGRPTDTKYVGEAARQKALSQLGKVKPDAGRTKVLFSPRAFANILVTAAIPSFLAHNKLEGRSAIRKAQKVANSNTSVIDNPRSEGRPFSRSFDDEGNPTQRTSLIEQGIVTNFLYDHYYGALDQTSSTGHAIRYQSFSGESLRHAPRPSALSLEVVAEEASSEDIVRDMGQGLIVESESNSHASKQATGYFSVAATSGYIVKNGEIAAPAKAFTVSGLSFQDLLPNLRLISKEKKTIPAFMYPTAVTTGYVLTENMAVAS